MTTTTQSKPSCSQCSNLLTALQNLVRDLEMRGEFDPKTGQTVVNCSRSIYSEAIAAIAKATGEPS